MYAVYPIHEPHTTRYRTAATPLVVQTAWWISSNSNAKIRFARPAKVICQAVPLKGSTSGVCHRLESTDPSAQLKDPPSKLRDQPSSFQRKVVPDINSGQIS